MVRYKYKVIGVLIKSLKKEEIALAKTYQIACWIKDSHINNPRWVDIEIADI